MVRLTEYLVPQQKHGYQDSGSEEASEAPPNGFGLEFSPSLRLKTLSVEERGVKPAHEWIGLDPPTQTSPSVGVIYLVPPWVG